MNLSLPYRFVIDFYDEQGSSLGVVAAQRDFEPLQEWTRFDCQRKGELSLDCNGSASVLPVWDGGAGEPYCRGFRVEIAEPGRPMASRHFPNSQFRAEARAAASEYVAQGRLRAGEKYTYLVLAHPAPPDPAAGDGMAITNASPALPAREQPLDPMLARSRPSGLIDPGDMPVFVAPRILDEIAAKTRAHEGTETGGILLGTLGRDPASGEIFAMLTAQIPAEHASGSAVKFSFTPQTWAAADAALRLRKRGEVFAGYFHSHPVASWCRSRSCTPGAQKTCPLARDFFSEDDATVMRAAFPSAWCVAIVANDTAFDLTFSMFGNKEGAMASRGFYILEENEYVTSGR